MSVGDGGEPQHGGAQPHVQLGLDGKPFESFDPRTLAGPRNPYRPDVPIGNWGTDPRDPQATARQVPYGASSTPSDAPYAPAPGQPHGWPQGQPPSQAHPQAQPQGQPEGQPLMGYVPPARIGLYGAPPEPVYAGITAEHNDHGNYSVLFGAVSAILAMISILFVFNMYVVIFGFALGCSGFMYGIRSHNSVARGLATNPGVGHFGMVLSGLALLGYIAAVVLIFVAIGTVVSRL